ncbi:Cytosol [Ecytonucleospora hepatopenaei]|uniref:leucyl aminopeptidase n=1 Tax=Ecytonucleospora hepatopenaei TaxID=646526 RepID=A0A1W0E417_9MICR|nr:Cytosol [Ecytonucleospora hepatopenaei]
MSLSLLDFKKLRNVLESKECTGNVVVKFFSGKEENVKVLCCNDSDILTFLKNKKVSGSHGEIFEYKQNILCGLGDLNEKEYDEVVAMNVQKSMGNLFSYISKYFKNYSIEFEEFSLVKHCYYGFILASYKYDFLRKDVKEDFKCNLKYPLEYKNVVEMAHCQNISRFLGDTPANLMTPTHFVEYAKILFENNEKVKMKVLEEEDCKKLGMNLMLSVGQGSKEKSKLLTLEYKGNSNLDDHKIAMVGKGVCFDSGGISLKPSLNMHHMKFDMMGAGTLIGAFKACVDANVKINMTCTIPLVENLPSSTATKPGDVFTAMNKMSVEIGNTDAEGRLILADAICYAQTQYSKKPEIIMDTATLTGAMVVALGNVYAGYFTNSEKLSKTIEEASKDSDELLWRMPLSKYYRKMLESDVADLNNIGGRGMGGSCSAAEFLHAFVEKDVEWVHFDIAGMMNEGFLKENYKSGGTGRPLPMFVEMVKKYASN